MIGYYSTLSHLMQSYVVQSIYPSMVYVCMYMHVWACVHVHTGITLPLVKSTRWIVQWWTLWQPSHAMLCNMYSITSASILWHVTTIHLCFLNTTRVYKKYVPYIVKISICTHLVWCIQSLWFCLEYGRIPLITTHKIKSGHVLPFKVFATPEITR